MKIVNALDKYVKSKNEIVVFLAGSTGRKNWRNDVIKFLDKIEQDKVLSLENLVIVNPYNSKLAENEEDLKTQVEWEASMIEQTDIFSCYLNTGSAAPMSLFELGKTLYMFKSKFANGNIDYRIIVSAHPEYEKLMNVKLSLAASTKQWKTPISEINIDKNVSSHASKILEAYIKFAK